MSRDDLRHKNAVPLHFAVDVVIYVAPNYMRNVTNALCIHIHTSRNRPVWCVFVCARPLHKVPETNEQ